MQQEVARLEEERVQVLSRLKTAREMGDLSENGAYRYAKFELGNIGRELRRLNRLIMFGEIVESTQNNEVSFGSRVTITANHQHVEYVLVSQHESDPSKGKLSFQSPIGKALMGKKVGDVVEVSVPAGVVSYTIEKIS